jgi:hypothetical protein
LLLPVDAEPEFEPEPEFELELELEFWFELVVLLGCVSGSVFDADCVDWSAAGLELEAELELADELDTADVFSSGAALEK